MNKREVIQNTIVFVKKTLKGSEGGHDWFHVNRVYKNALLIAKSENVDLFVVGLPKKMNNQPSLSESLIKPFIIKLKSSFPKI